MKKINSKIYATKWYQRAYRTVFAPNFLCDVCQQPLNVETPSGICQSCYQSLSFNNKKQCTLCGRKVVTLADVCNTCKTLEHAFDRSMSVFSYESTIAALVQRFKFNHAIYLSNFFGGEMAALFSKENINCDFICYVPISFRRFLQRGYNQAAELAKIVSECTQVPIYPCLEKFRHTSHQTGLSKQQRNHNLQNSIRLKECCSVKDKSILLIDDVMTTGATGDVCAKILKAKKAKSVTLLTLCSVPETLPNIDINDMKS